MSKDQADSGKVGKRRGHQAPAGYDPSEYENPAVACDVVIVAFSKGRLKVLLIERKHDPYQGYWATPGGFVEMDESLESAAAREVFEETGIEGIGLIPLGAFGDPDRDPRTRVISVAYLALVKAGETRPRAGDDAKEVAWRDLAALPELAFDCDKIVARARERLRELAVLGTRLFDLLPETFTAGEYLALAGEVAGVKHDEAAFVESLERIPCFVGEGGGSYRLDRSLYRDGDLMFLLLGERGNE